MLVLNNDPKEETNSSLGERHKPALQISFDNRKPTQPKALFSPSKTSHNCTNQLQILGLFTLQVQTSTTTSPEANARDADVNKL